MFSHVMLGADDIEASRKFYDAILGALGVAPGVIDPKGRVWWRTERGNFAISKPIDGGPASCANGGTIGFAAPSVEMANAFHEAGLANGGTAIEDPPGTRESPFGALHLAYLRDPSGNKVAVMHRLRG
ncbi:MAG TPA: VOC family protein [Brevundimonas sp.]|jgi:catechol 2,3-dioxygenase-like lactoylglutathione lyase family enzyme